LSVAVARAPAKLNLSLVVGGLRPDGKHEVVTVLCALALHDELRLEPADELEVTGFAQDTLVAEALRLLGRAAGVEPAWRVRITKRIPVAAGLGGGSSDAAAALRLANATLARPLADAALHELAAVLGADVPFFLHGGVQLGAGDGTQLEPLRLPCDYQVVLLRPHAVVKESTAAVYRRFDERDGAAGFEARRRALFDALSSVARAEQLEALPANDLASSPHARRLVALGAFRADVSGAGPVVYGLFSSPEAAEAARTSLGDAGETWLTEPAC
jgi:4-diphosphocytidyl-2-C-methyl-D-erythritol kinase